MTLAEELRGRVPKKTTQGQIVRLFNAPHRDNDPLGPKAAIPLHLEDRVWDMVQRGKSQRMIASRLGISGAAVTRHIKNRVRRLNSQLEKAIGA